MECGGKVRAADGDAALVVRGAREAAWSWFRHKPKRRRWRRTPKEDNHAAVTGGDGVTLVPQKQLRHVFHVTSGATPESGNAEFWGGDILWATPEDISSLDGYLLRDTRRKITRSGYESCGTTMAFSAPVRSTLVGRRSPSPVRRGGRAGRPRSGSSQ